MKKLIWCLFHCVKNNKKSSDLDSLIYKCIEIIDNCKNRSVTIDFFYINIYTSSNTIRLWNANKFYSWISRGEIDGVSFSNTSPSSAAMYDFKECLKRNNYNIYIPEPKNIINISNIKC